MTLRTCSNSSTNDPYELIKNNDNSFDRNVRRFRVSMLILRLFSFRLSIANCIVDKYFLAVVIIRGTEISVSEI